MVCLKKKKKTHLRCKAKKKQHNQSVSYCQSNLTHSYSHGVILDYSYTHPTYVTLHACKSMQRSTVFKQLNLTYTHVHPHNFWGSLASSCQCGSWQTGFCCVCQRKWSGIDLRDSLTEHWTGEERRWEREGDTDKGRESDRHRKRDVEGEERSEDVCICTCVCVCARVWVCVSWRGKCRRLNHVWRWQGLRTPCCWGNKTKQQAQMYKL